VAVIGAGSWGTAVAGLTAANVPTVLWARDAELAAAIDGGGVNPRYLPDHRLPDALRSTASLAEAVADATLVLMAVPSHGFRAVAGGMADALPPGTPVVSLTKGLERGSRLRMTEVLAQELPATPTGVLTGPNLASEVVAGQPTAAVVALADEAAAARVQWTLMSPTFRVYTSVDVRGCELAGALKNVLAVAAGISDGLGFGDNTRAALITRGLAEMGRLGVRLGGDRMTFAGLAGVGDLVATCTSPRSRNRTVGVALGQGRTLDDILGSMTMVAEGVKTARPMVELAASYDVEVPIAHQVADLLDGVRSPAEAIAALMERPASSEFPGTPG
jgi:glycerol-3-phosphate dehydrogenase (NAD(P)+)